MEKGDASQKIYNNYLIHGKINIDNFTVVILVESTISKSITYVSLKIINWVDLVAHSIALNGVLHRLSK